MKIAITADPFIPVPPENYGGIERVIYFLVEGLANRGHDVLLVAHSASNVNVPLIKYPKERKGVIGHLRNAITINRLNSFKPDIIHSFSRLAYLLPFLPRNISKIMSYQREPSISQIKKAVGLAKKGTLTFTGCSNYISNSIKPYSSAYTIYNGVEFDKFICSEQVTNDAPLIFLGRIEFIKGTHIAIQVALKAKRKLIIAGNVPPSAEAYFNNQVKPFLSDQIIFAGPVNDIQKNDMLRKAAALLMPIQWNEPFGIVMAEAMACGTPVLGFPFGAVEEVIVDGVSGFICKDEEHMVNQVARLNELNRKTVADLARQRFSSDKILEGYLNLYTKLIDKKAVY